MQLEERIIESNQQLLEECQQEVERYKILLERSVEDIREARELVIQLRQENRNLREIISDIEPLIKIDKNRTIFFSAGYPMNVQIGAGLDLTNPDNKITLGVTASVGLIYVRDTFFPLLNFGLKGEF